MLQWGEGDAEEAPRPDHQQLAVLTQIGGEEDDDADLGQLGRLEGDRTEADPQVGAVDLGADQRQPRGHQQGEADQGDRVPVPLEHRVVAEDLDHDREEDQPEHEPVGLVAGQLTTQFGVEPVEHDESEGGQQRHQREEVRVSVGQADPDVDVGGEADRQEVEPVGETQVGQLAVVLREDRGEAGGQEQGNRDEGQ